MSSSDRTRGNPPPGRTDAAGAPSSPAPAGAKDPYANWLDRMQRARTRHAAITRNLHTWSNYKSWAEQVKGSWDEDEKK